MTNAIEVVDVHKTYQARKGEVVHALNGIRCGFFDDIVVGRRRRDRLRSNLSLACGPRFESRRLIIRQRSAEQRLAC